jgi:AsmA protein
MRIMMVVLGVLAVLVVAVLAAPMLVPRDWLVAKVSDVVRDATGRSFAVDGAVSLALVPTPRLVAEGIRVGEGDTPLLRLGKLEAVVALGPLLGGRIEVQRLILVEPVATLRIDAQGNGNWQAGRADPAHGDTPPSGGEPSKAPSLPDLALGDVRVEDGVVDFADARSNLAERVEDIDLALDAPSLRGPAALTGTALVRGENIELDLKVAQLGELVSKTSSPGSVAIRGPVAASLDGTLSASPAGEVRIAIPDVARGLQWLKVQAPAGAPLPKELTVSGDLAVQGKVVRLDAAELASDLLQGKGNVAYDGSGNRPKLSGAFETGVIDTERFAPRPAAAAAETQPAAAPPAPAAASAGPAPAADTPLNLPTSLPIDLDVTLRAAGVKTPKANLGRTHLRATSGAKYLLVQLLEVQAYSGKLTGQLNSAADANGIPRLAVKLAAAGVQLGALLNDVAKDARLDGRLAINLDVTGDSRSVNSLLGGMDGKADVTLLAGAVQGIDLTRLTGDPATVAATVAREGWRGGSTRIDRASATFAIANGVAVTNDIAAQAPPLQLAGDGRLNLATRRIDQLRLVPTAMAGQAEQTLGRLPKVPILISGPFDALSISVDTKGVLQELAKDPKNVQRVIDQVNRLGGSKDGKPVIPENAGKLLEGLLGRQ